MFCIQLWWHSNTGHFVSHGVAAMRADIMGTVLVQDPMPAQWFTWYIEWGQQHEQSTRKVATILQWAIMAENKCSQRSSKVLVIQIQDQTTCKHHCKEQIRPKLSKRQFWVEVGKCLPSWNGLLPTSAPTHSPPWRRLQNVVSNMPVSHPVDLREHTNIMSCHVWKRIGVMVCKKSAYPNCSGALTNCYGRLITATEDLKLLRNTYQLLRNTY